MYAIRRQFCRRFSGFLSSPALVVTLFLSFGFWISSAKLIRTEEQSGSERKVPPTLLAGLEAGEEQSAIVLFDASNIERKAADMRRSARVRVNDRVVLDFKSAELGMLKQNVMSTLIPGSVTVLVDYNHLPMSFVRIHSRAALAALADRPEVMDIFENQARYRTLEESLPLINQPPVAADGHTGAGTTIAVLDTGVDYKREAFGACDSPGVPAGCRVVFATDFASEDGLLDDTIRHGTNVAGTALGVAPDANIAALDVFTGDFAYDSDIIAAINWSIDNQATYNIVAMNLSLGGRFSSTVCPQSAYTTPFENARQAGITPVVASGNNAQSAGMAFPACTPGAVRVGAVYDSDVGAKNYSVCSDSTTTADQVTCFSNSADFLTLLAPGAIITAAGVTMQGTSQATPHVAGAVAVLMGANSTLAPNNVESSLTTSGIPVLDPRNGLTFPRLDLQAAVAVAENNAPPLTPSNPSPVDQATNVPVTPTLFWTGGDPDSADIVTYDVYFGSTSNPPLVSEGQSATNYSPGSLNGKVYYWRVVARDEHGFETEGPTWIFSTENDVCFDSVEDGSFEGGTPSAAWDEVSLNFGTPICSLDSCGADRANTGDWFLWFGGTPDLEVAYIEQQVSIGEDAGTLSFHLWIGATSGLGIDFLRVLVDDTEVFYTLEGNPNYIGGYNLVQLDLSAFADGGSHLLRFESITWGLRVTNFFVDDISIETCFASAPPVSPGDELAADFGEDRGLWHLDGSSWSSLTSWDPSQIVAWGRKMAAAFGPSRGVQVYDQTGWTKITSWDPYEMVAWGNKLTAAFDAGRGLWVFDDATGWTKLTSWEPLQVVAGGDKLVAAFGVGRGLWLYDSTGWVKISSWNPSSVVAWGDKVAAAFDASRGLWVFDDATGWTKLTSWEPEQMVSWGDKLAAAFGVGRGLWLYDSTEWAKISSWNPFSVVAWGDKVAAAFDASRGMWVYNDTTGWTKLTSWQPVKMEPMAEALAAAFSSGKGVYKYDSSGWTKLESQDSEDIEAVNIF